MLYEKKTSSFEIFLNDLRKQLEKEVSAEELDIVCEYLDLTKPRNNALLGKIGKKNRDIFNVSVYFIDRIVEKEIKKDNVELSERFILVIYTLFGCASHRLLESFMEDKYMDENPEAYISRIIKPISDNLGIDPEVVLYSMRMEDAFRYEYKFFPKPTQKSVLRGAYNFMDSASLYRCMISKAVLLCYLLEQEDKELSEDGKWAVETAEKLWKENNTIVCQKYRSNDDKQYLLEILAYMTCALGEAAPYSSKAREQFNHIYSKVTREAVEAAIKVPNPFAKLFKYIESNNEEENNTIKVLNPVMKFFKSGKTNNVTPKYISSIVLNTESLSEYINKEILPDRDEWIERLAKTYPNQFKEAISILGDEIQLAKYMSEILQRVDPNSASIVDEVRDMSRKKLAEAVRRSFSKSINGNPYCEIVEKYILGEASLEEARPSTGGGWNLEADATCDYYNAWGLDEYLAHAVTILSLCSYESPWERHHYINKLTGFDVDEYKETFDILRGCGLSFIESLNIISIRISIIYQEHISSSTKLLSSYPNELAETDFSLLSDTARIIAIKVMGNDAERFKTKLLSCVSDSSKKVRDELAEVLEKQDWHDDIAAMLKDKKGTIREMAVAIIGRQGAKAYTDELNAALEVEKSAKIKGYIDFLLNSPSSTDAITQLDKDKQIAKLAKSAKSSKLSFLFNDTLRTVHKLDGSEASEDTVVALVMCYAGMTVPARSGLADSIAADLNQKDLEDFSADIFARWFDNGAQAKFKSVLYFCAIHGGHKMVEELIHNIKEWSEAMRSAIAAETVMALALNGSNEALMNVDNMSRKFKNKRVRAAAGEAMAAAADTLGITTEELADRIVPDLGFDSNLCRVFDYGKRQFKVYLKPSLELEIFAGDKQVKALPKPGTTDDKDTADAAYDEFKEMKKQLKNVVTAQRARLEYVLMCDRKWTSENWEKLFVGNAVMHSFAVGLIWGVYENGSLKETFRYMDDGSFTNADGDEYTFPKDALIGLVHPLELTEDQIAVWKEHLSDYELTQPFDQLGRMVFRPEDKELPCNHIIRFENISTNSLALVNKMTKNGWYKGDAEDAGYFYYFYRKDVKSRTPNADGTTTQEGWGSILTHSGASIVVYDYEGEEVTLGKLLFFKAGDMPAYYDKEEDGIKISDVDPRYFSETMLLLNSIVPQENK
ncbi:MAG: DUF4132 domain-containing protein [Paludibacteraceae bacterium]|nr:DUF4132 domain-containing protein [Paludibacteraceae bacterium]